MPQYENKTTAKLGSSPLTLEWSGLFPSTRLLEGSPEDKSSKDSIMSCWTKLKTRLHDKDVGFYDSPITPKISQINETIALAREVTSPLLFTDFLFLGIGGSALGPISLLSALQDRCTPQFKFHFLENPDPYEWRSTLAKLKPQSTLVVVVAKSGSTFETLAQFLLAAEWLGPDRIKTHVVAITDPAKGDLKAWATSNHVRTLDIAPSLGGRFSVFSPVGLFAAALAGLNVHEILAGATSVRAYCESTPAQDNVLFWISSELVRHYPQFTTHVCMPYSTRLRFIGDWFVQLWGESLGKNGKGFTPIAAVGATDQHSILQLLRDGPNDKVTLFVTLENLSDPCKISDSKPQDGFSQYPSFKILQGHSLGDLLNFEYEAIAKVLTNQKRPNLTLRVEDLSEKSLGAIYFAFSVLTAFTGVLWGVEPFDQPGVEEGKIYIKNSLNHVLK